MRDALLLLMHQGNSFVEEIRDALQPLGIPLIAVTSIPSRREVMEANQAFLDDWIEIDRDRLQMCDGEMAREEFEKRGYRIVAALATFEGYRLIMAALNETLCARDSGIEALRLCLNKYTLRRALLGAGLSEVSVFRVGSDEINRIDMTRKWFVKPVRGASSFGCFMLEKPEDLEDVRGLQEQMKSDSKMASIFMGDFDFLVEEFVEGPELSFEIIAAKDIHHICVHEKTEVERQARTTLEAMSVSPPVSLDADIITEGAEFITRCFRELGLNAGAFHVEAKYWESRKKWEVIEINPRMGGSLINASIAVVTGLSMLDLWIKTLVLEGDAFNTFDAFLGGQLHLDALRARKIKQAAIFVSKYGEKGRTIDRIVFKTDERPPEICNLHERDGSLLANSDRAICLMDALWKVDCALLEAEIPVISRYVDDSFEVIYR